ncbi:MAG: cohesin domain-containing protein, partial [ANME-2 cluster archaeon]|nr:cohesin domain-containing protein [ANME-2 cluster archaeon]
MIRKTITVALMIFGLSLITISTAASAATISIGNGSAGVGGTVVVPLMINDVTCASSVEINLTYDPSVVIPVSITNSDFDLPPQDPPINPQSGHIIINAMQFAAGLDGNVKIGDITLQAIGDEGGSSPLNLTDVTLQDMAMQDIPIDSVINGVFEVRDITPPSVTDLSANPHIISNNGVMESRLNITVTDNNTVESVIIDLSPVGGSQSQSMSPAGSNIWTVTTGATLSGVRDLTVNATDVWGNSNTSTSIELIVVEPAVVEIGPAVHIQPGETVIVPLLINGASADAGVGVVEVNLTYDPSVVIPVSITNSDFDLPPQDPPVNPQSGYVIINAMQISSGLSGTVRIGDITLQA